jgi:hypothetical protein
LWPHHGGWRRSEEWRGARHLIGKMNNGPAGCVTEPL